MMTTYLFNFKSYIFEAYLLCPLFLLSLFIKIELSYNKNKELIHLQNNITQCYKKDLSHYTNDESLITTINEHGKIIA